VVGHLSALHGVMHALPLTYNKDLQEDKEHLFDAVDTLELSLLAATRMLSTITFDRARMSAAAADEFPAATDVADELVRRGVPFRESHGIVAGLVRAAIEQGKQLTDLDPAEVAQVAPQLGDEGLGPLLAGGWLDSKVSEGGTALERVREQLERARATVAGAPR
jgi:argininosuccinate lyase